jgi:hypothetical protein
MRLLPIEAHRHEPPVSGDDVSVVYEDDDMVCTTICCEGVYAL